MKKIIGFLFLFLIMLQANAQKNNSRDSGLVQFSGLLLSADSIIPIPFANIFISHRKYGTYSNLDGYFSFVAKKGDTVVFTHVEFKNTYYVVSDTLTDHKYSIVKLMVQDTFFMPGVVVRAMPNRATFDHMFVTKTIPDDDLQRAKNNLERERLRDLSAGGGPDASLAYKNMVNQYNQRALYSHGQIPPMNVLNPFAWLQFFESWKRGDYKAKAKPIPKVNPVSK